MKHNQKMFLLAISVVLCFVLAAVVISYRNYLLFSLFLFGGFALMGYGLSLKRAYYAKLDEENKG